MVHLVYCDDKEKVLGKILDDTKTMVIRGAARRKKSIEGKNSRKIGG